MSTRYRTRINGYRCIYCGEPADTEEHWPPISHCIIGYLLPACLECNMIAGDKYSDHFIKRVNYIKSKLKSKYRVALSQKDWAEDELEELSETLQKEIKEWHKRKMRALNRIAWNAIAYIASIDLTNVFVLQFANSDITEQKQNENLQDLTYLSNLRKRLNNRAIIYQSKIEIAMIRRYEETGDITVLNRWAELFGDKYLEFPSAHLS